MSVAITLALLPLHHDDLFRSRLDSLIDPRHGLVQLGDLIDWSGFDDVFGRFYRSAGRPGLADAVDGRGSTTPLVGSTGVLGVRPCRRG